MALCGNGLNYFAIEHYRPKVRLHILLQSNLDLRGARNLVSRGKHQKRLKDIYLVTRFEVHITRRVKGKYYNLFWETYFRHSPLMVSA